MSGWKAVDGGCVLELGPFRPPAGNWVRQYGTSFCWDGLCESFPRFRRERAQVDQFWLTVRRYPYPLERGETRVWMFPASRLGQYLRSKVISHFDLAPNERLSWGLEYTLKRRTVAR